MKFYRLLTDALQKLRTASAYWIVENRPLLILTWPFVYGMIIPMVFFDVSLTVYQNVCFRFYGIPRVQRGQYIVTDRRRLKYLNFIGKLNCEYCSYANGLVSYSREIFARTEQHWCPIKHARRIKDPHGRYADFLPYGDAEAYNQRLNEIRKNLSNEGSKSSAS